MVAALVEAVEEDLFGPEFHGLVVVDLPPEELRTLVAGEGTDLVNTRVTHTSMNLRRARRSLSSTS